MMFRGLFVLFFLPAFCIAASVQPVDLRCEHLNNPIGLDIARPLLAWRLQSTSPNASRQQQTGYHLRVTRNAEQTPCWDTGEVPAESSQSVEYNGAGMNAGDTLTWTVRVRDEAGEWSDWSAPAQWTMGPMRDADWSATWIGSPDLRGRKLNIRPGKTPPNNDLADPWVRKTVNLVRQPKQAFFYVASIGYHEVFVNGKRIGDAVLSPSATNHAKRARYVTYDITNQLRPGRNAVCIWLGTGWSIFPSYQTPDKPAGPIVLAQIDATLEDGQVIRIGTNGTWKVRPSPNRFTGFWDAHGFAGECYDAREELPNWCEASLDDSDWQSATEFSPRLQISADRIQANRLQNEVRPVAIDEVKPNVWRIDMGVNFTGWFEAELAGTPGQPISIKFSERAESEMTFGLNSTAILGASGRINWRNRFNYMTGRWVQISGVTQKPDLSKVRGWIIRTDYARAGTFECDDAQLNALYAATNFTFENCTLGGMLVDCPHRERRGYGDGFGATRMAFDNYDLAAFYCKWAEDWRDVSRPNGDVAYTAPTIAGGGGPAWSGFCVSLPWEIYKRYGDRRPLEAGWPQIRAWLAFLETQSQDNLLRRYGGRWSFLGDWQWPGFWPERQAVEKQKKAMGDTPEALFFNNCYWIYNLQTAAKIGDVLGDTQTAQAFRDRADEIRRAVHTRFFNPGDHSYVNGYPAYLSIALLVNLPPADLYDEVWARMENEIRQKRSGHIWAGIIGGAFLFETLLDARRDDLIYEMVKKTDSPSWTDMLAKGGGTFHEDWDGRGTRLHDSFLYIGGFFIESLGGIRQSASAYRRLLIQPWITRDAGPQWVNASYDSPQGKIVVRWKKSGNNVALHIELPPGSLAELRLPFVDHIQVRRQELKYAGDVLLEAGVYEVTGQLK